MRCALPSSGHENPGHCNTWASMDHVSSGVLRDDNRYLPRVMKLKVSICNWSKLLGFCWPLRCECYPRKIRQAYMCKTLIAPDNSISPRVSPLVFHFRMKIFQRMDLQQALGCLRGTTRGQDLRFCDVSPPRHLHKDAHAGAPVDRDRESSRPGRKTWNAMSAQHWSSAWLHRKVQLKWAVCSFALKVRRNLWTGCTADAKHLSLSLSLSLSEALICFRHQGINEETCYNSEIAHLWKTFTDARSSWNSERFIIDEPLCATIERVALVLNLLFHPVFILYLQGLLRPHETSVSWNMVIKRQELWIFAGKNIMKPLVLKTAWIDLPWLNSMYEWLSQDSITSRVHFNQYWSESAFLIVFFMRFDC